MADAKDADALTQAFTGCDAVYLMNPPALGDPDLFATARLTVAAPVAAAKRAGIRRVVGLSSGGAEHASGTGNILTGHILETELAGYPGAVTLLRASYFMENLGGMLPIVKAGEYCPRCWCRWIARGRCKLRVTWVPRRPRS